MKNRVITAITAVVMFIAICVGTAIVQQRWLNTSILMYSAFVVGTYIMFRHARKKKVVLVLLVVVIVLVLAAGFLDATDPATTNPATTLWNGFCGALAVNLARAQEDD